MTNSKEFVLKGVLLTDTPTKTGRIYPHAVMEKALREYKAKYVDKRLALGELRDGNGAHTTATVNLDKVSHEITDVSLDETGVNCTVRVLDTPVGKRALECALPITVDIRALACVKDWIVQDDLEILSFDLVNPNE